MESQKSLGQALGNSFCPGLSSVATLTYRQPTRHLVQVAEHQASRQGRAVFCRSTALCWSMKVLCAGYRSVFDSFEKKNTWQKTIKKHKDGLKAVPKSLTLRQFAFEAGSRQTP